VQLLPKDLDIAPAPAHILSRSQSKRNVLLPKINLLAPLLPNPSKALFNDDAERGYFDIFSSKTAFEILPSFDSGTLRQILLQACVSDPSIRHGVIALGALDKTATSFEAFGAPSMEDERRQFAQHHQNALKQYLIAIQYMRAAASSSMQDLRTTLLTCLVIFCFEAWDGLKENAVQQIQTGLRLIRNWRDGQMDERRPLEAPPQSAADLEEDLVRTFNRLDVQAISFAYPDECSHERQHLIMTQEAAILNQMPQVFSSVQDAEVYESAIIRRTMRFLSFQVPLPKLPRPYVMFPVNGWYGLRSDPVVTTQQSIIAEIMRWEASMDPLWRRLKTQNDPSLTIAAMLRMHIKTAYQALLQICIENEEKWDDLQGNFTEIVELAECTLLVLDAANSSTSRFQFDSHLVIPLHMVGHKCRDPKLRRRAISLMLRNPRREGVWDSVLAGRCTQWAMEVEEEHLEHGKVPGWARIHGVILERDKKSRRVTFTCEQRLSPTSEEVVTLQQTMIW
jgi:hypothetical protein